MAPNKLNEKSRRFAHAILKVLLQDQASIYGALLSSIDGHGEAFITEKELHASKLSAMTSSLIALGESLAKEAKQSQCQFVIVQNSDGFTVTQRIGKRHALTAFASSTVSLGMLLASVRTTAEKLEQTLN